MWVQVTLHVEGVTYWLNTWSLAAFVHAMENYTWAIWVFVHNLFIERLYT